jgi:hypothetical protein
MTVVLTPRINVGHGQAAVISITSATEAHPGKGRAIANRLRNSNVLSGHNAPAFALKE